MIFCVLNFILIKPQHKMYQIFHISIFNFKYRIDKKNCLHPKIECRQFLFLLSQNLFCINFSHLVLMYLKNVLTVFIFNFK